VSNVVERKPRSAAASCRRVGATVDDSVEVCLAEQTVVSTLTELVTGNELPLTDDALEALDVVDLVSGPHHQVVLGERHAAFRAPRSEQPIIIIIIIIIIIKDNVYGTVIVTYSHYESSPGSS